VVKEQVLLSRTVACPAGILETVLDDELVPVCLEFVLTGIGNAVVEMVGIVELVVVVLVPEFVVDVVERLDLVAVLDFGLLVVVGVFGLLTVVEFPGIA